LGLEIELYGAGTARTLRPIWMAEEIGMQYTLYPIGPRTGETQTEEFKILNPKKKIPLLKHGDFVLSESIAICRYLQRIENEKDNLVPSDLKLKALEDEWCNFIYGELDETSLYVMRRHGDLKNIYGHAPNVLESCKEYFYKHLQVIEQKLANQDTLFGLDFGLADIILVSCLDWAIAYEFELSVAVQSYHENIKKRGAYKKAIEINYGI